ncbi:MAG TPA: primosomal protein N' [Burkholderiales bacterium]|nr:primosomal protein N' [Burkholderiales bacterium]
MKVVRVALDVPLPTLLDYLPAPGCSSSTDSLMGCRVRVPFGRGHQIGVVLEVSDASSVPSEKLKAITTLLDTEPVLTPDVLELVRFAADYYHHPIGQSVAVALPKQLREIDRARSATGPRFFALSAAGRGLDLATIPTRAVVQRQIVQALRDRELLADSQLHTLAASAPRVLRALIERGYIEQIHIGDPVGDGLQVRPGPPLTVSQRSAVDNVLRNRDTFAPFLLHGVTGGGKTEVYLELIAEMIAAGRQSLILVPEIGLTPQLLDRVRTRFPERNLAVLHSNLAAGERLRGWRAAQRGEAKVVIGTRLAVFVPMPMLGLIVVDEEHDISFKQQEGLRYSARDLALLRAKLRAVPVVLGSATPSLESYANALAHRYTLLELPHRAAAAPPTIRCVDIRKVKLYHGLSPQLIDALRERVKRREQSLIFVNRRGYAPALVCSACGWASPCPRCSAKLVLHVRDACLRCHYCGHRAPVDKSCPSCGNQDLLPAGEGSQRIERALQDVLPGAVIRRVDRDSTRGRQAFLELQEVMRGNQVDVLVGTQMLVKGHDFPRITLVGVVNADSALFSNDFRASERLYSQLVQVAGRAGRAELEGEVLIQTRFPDHPLYAAVSKQDYSAFAQAALLERRQANFPPYSYHALLRAEANRREAVDAYLHAAAAAGLALKAAVEIYDPVPPAIARIAGNERGHLLVQARSRSELQRFLHAWYPHLTTRSVRWSLDVDPTDL